MRQNKSERVGHSTNALSSTLQLSVLGAYEATLGEQPLADLGSRKAYALLFYLAVTGKPVPRATLTALLWPEMAEKAAKNNLRTTLTILKQKLGPYLIATTSDVTFNRQLPYALDIERLYAGLDRVRATNDLTALQAAIDLYRGEFLQGFHLNGAEPFEEWMLLQREQLHLQVVRALETIMALALAQHSYHAGVLAGQKLLTMEPWSEEAHRQLMMLFARSGQRGRALQQYKACCRLLTDELGVAPTAETTALYRQIQTGQLEKTAQIHRSGFADSQQELPHQEWSVITRRPVARRSIPSASNAGVAVPNNLHASLVPFIGRKAELTYLLEQLTKDSCRLLTIFGPGGVGKSTLALTFGQRLLSEAPPPFPDGVFFVPLAGVGSDSSSARQDPIHGRRAYEHLITTTIAESIGCRFQGSQPLEAQLIDYLQHRRLLLILDNFEQLVDHACILTDVVMHAPTVTMLITSRTRLNIRGETTLLLDGLSLAPPTNELVPDTPNIDQDAVQMSEAVALFVNRAQTLIPNFRLDAKTIGPISQICQALVGLPLAIEMAAAWVTLYSCAEIAERLTGEGPQVELLTSQFQDQPERHQNLQKVFEDSWALLPESAQWALAKVSLFSGYFTRAAAQAIADLSLADLMHLRNHSMLQVDEEHLYTLHPLIRQFATRKWEQLTQQQREVRGQLRNAHSMYYLQRIADLAKHPHSKEDFATIHKLKQDHTEIVRAWQWALQQHSQTQIERTMVGLFRYLEVTNQSAEGKTLFDVPFSGTPGAGDHAPVALWLQVAQCHFMRRLAEYDEARQRLEALIAVVSPLTVGEQVAQAKVATVTDGDAALSPRTYTFALCVLGWIHYEQGNYESAHSCFSTAHGQAGRTGDPARLMEVHNGLGAVAFSVRQYESARMHYEAALIQANQQADLHYTAIILGNLAAYAQATKAFVEAERYLQMRLQIDHQTQNVRQMAISHQRLGQLALINDAYIKAEAHLRKSLALFEQLGNSPELAHVLHDLSQSLLHQRKINEASEQCLRGLQAAMQARLTPRISAALTLLAEIRIAEEQKEEALTLLQMVSRTPQIPAVTWRKAQKLQETLGEYDMNRNMPKLVHRLYSPAPGDDESDPPIEN